MQLRLKLLGDQMPPGVEEVNGSQRLALVLQSSTRSARCHFRRRHSDKSVALAIDERAQDPGEISKLCVRLAMFIVLE